MTQVAISDGVLEGELVDNEFGGKFYSFKGIPYAVPPLGDLRFKAPQLAKPWDGVRSAKQCGPMCNQRGHFLRTTPGWKRGLSVLKCLHGDDEVYGPELLVRHDVVIVSINCRLGVLGFLCLDSEDVPGNARLKDQMLALKWVQKNISHFGGDAYNVTIFGESAGGASVGYHLISPMSKDLFKRAICQSGCSLNSWLWQSNLGL
ncbi:hypothetical protein ACJJTC_007290 [Scirpophaga incertulas]